MKKNFYLATAILCVIFTVYTFVNSEVLGGYGNNKYGIHLATHAESELDEARNLVNSNGGEWGYVTLVMQRSDMEKHILQDTFDKLRERKLIPILRLATGADGENWIIPQSNDAFKYARYLGELNWPVRERYVVLFNEPNHGSEWGGKCNPKSYGSTALLFARALREESEDFVIMLAGFDQSAPHVPPMYCDEEIFLQEVVAHVPDITSYIGGIASHSYPNPSFSASPLKRGRGSIAGYRWELDLFARLGFESNLPVYITETGWTNNLGENVVADYFRDAFSLWNADDAVRAVTPFILTYEGYPFEEFAWVRGAEKTPRLKVGVVLGAQKVAGEPAQIQGGSFRMKLPKTLVQKSQYAIAVALSNEGQAIWSDSEGYRLDMGEGEVPFAYQFEKMPAIRPGEKSEVALTIELNGSTGRYILPIKLYKKNEEILNLTDWHIEIISPPKLMFRVSSLPFFSPDKDVSIEVYDANEKKVFSQRAVAVKGGAGLLQEIHGVMLGETYKVVLVKKGFFSRQLMLTVEQENNVSFPFLLPGDFDHDGTWSVGDVRAILLSLIGRG